MVFGFVPMMCICTKQNQDCLEVSPNGFNGFKLDLLLLFLCPAGRIIRTCSRGDVTRKDLCEEWDCFQEYFPNPADEEKCLQHTHKNCYCLFSAGITGVVSRGDAQETRCIFWEAQLRSLQGLHAISGEYRHVK